jgi:microcystin-dependent protein
MADASKIKLTEGDAPSTPPAGTIFIYAKTDSEFYQKDSTGQETALGQVQPLATTDSPQFATVKLTGLTDDYIPYHVNDATGLANGPTKTNVDSAISLKHANSADHTQHTDTGTTGTSFIINSGSATKKYTVTTDGLAANKSNDAADIDSAITLKHANTTDHAIGGDTTLGAMSADINMNTHQVTALSAPDANGEAIRATTKITEINLESAVDLKHAAVTVTSPIVVDAGQALSHVDTDGNKHIPANSTTNEGKVLTAGATAGAYTWEKAGGGVTEDVHQVTHAFPVGCPIYRHTGAYYAKADCTTEAKAELAGVVSEVAGVDDFTLLGGGKLIVTDPSTVLDTGSWFTDGAVYFLSATAGKWTLTEPTTEGYVSKGILIGTSTTTATFYNMRGAVIGGGATTFFTTFDNTDLAAGVLTCTHNFGHQYTSTPTVIDNNGKVIPVADDIDFISTTALTIDLSSFGTISGTWRVVIQDSGASTAADAVSDTVYGVGWDGVTGVAPSKHATYDAINERCPVGMPATWLTETVPTGWLERNGASLDRTTYAALFAVIGTIYGTADASHFNLPDHRGSFPRYWDHAKAKDPDRATRTAVTAAGATMTAGDHVGTEQAEAFKSHDHPVSGGVGIYGAKNGTGAYDIPSGAGARSYSPITADANGGNETRPVNHYEMPIIKY